MEEIARCNCVTPVGVGMVALLCFFEPCAVLSLHSNPMSTRGYYLLSLVIFLTLRCDLCAFEYL